MKRGYISAVLFLSLLIVLYAVSAEDWPLFKKDISNSGISSDQIPDDPIILWSADIQRMETTPTAVSYTHLDVYKRQQLHYPD